MHTPWGRADFQKVLAPGIISVSTPGHGGIHLDEELNKKVPAYMRSSDGWYEEDVDWAIVATVFPEAFSEEDRKHAEVTVRNSIPQAYELFYGVVIPPGKSRAKDQDAFRALHKNDYIVMAAFGPGAPGVKFDIPEGQVLVFVGRGGRTKDYRYPKDTAYFLVPDEEYDAKGPFGFVIDESRHQRVDYKG